MMNVQEESKTRSRIEEITVALEEIGEISYKVLAQMREKKEDYFGQVPEKPSGPSGVTVDNGIIDKMSKSIIFIKGNLVEISEIIKLF